jgi:hypothetical protein
LFLPVNHRAWGIAPLSKWESEIPDRSTFAPTKSSPSWPPEMHAGRLTEARFQKRALTPNDPTDGMMPAHSPEPILPAWDNFRNTFLIWNGVDRWNRQVNLRDNYFQRRLVNQRGRLYRNWIISWNCLECVRVLLLLYIVSMLYWILNCISTWLIHFANHNYGTFS